MKHRGSYALGALMVALTLFISPAKAGADLLDGVGVLGSSSSDEYQFFDSRSAARNWVEVLATARGWNFGSFTTESRGVPRNQGYEYDWALAGATTRSLLARGQHDGLAAQVRGGEVTLAFVWIGGNNFRALLNADPPLSRLPPTVVPNAVADTIQAITTLLDADPNVRIVVAMQPDLRHSPEARLAIADARVAEALVDEISEGVRHYNAQLMGFAATESRVAVADLYALFEGVMSPEQFIVGGQRINRQDPSTDPDHFWTDDIHAGTVGQALVANSFIDTINARFGAHVPRLSETEILRAAGLPEANLDHSRRSL